MNGVFNPINDRLVKVTIKVGHLSITMLSVYAPTEVELVWRQDRKNRKTKLRLFKATVLPVLFYESESWAPLSHQDNDSKSSSINVCELFVVSL